MAPTKYTARTATLDEELRYYETTAVCSDIFSFWNENEKNYPVLSKIVKRLFAFQATSVASERLFSAAGYSLWDRRASLSPHKLDKIIVIQQFLTRENIEL